jgi:ABC-type multidrug transport system permease subunit
LVVFLLVIGGMFANGHPFERRRVSVVVLEPAAAAPPLARLPGVRIVRERTETAALGGLRSRMTDAVLVVRGEGARVLVRRDDELFGRGLAAALPEAWAAGPGDPSLDTASVTMEIVPAPRWGYLHYLVPGMLALSVVLTGLYGMGYSMVRYRATRFLKKLSTTPLSKTTFVGAQIAARAALVLAQSILMLLAARLFFGLPLSAVAFGWMLALTTLGLLTFMGAGFALACVIKTEGHMQDVINTITGPIVLLSEVFFAADALPGPLPQVCAALPSTQLVRLSRAVLLQGETQPGALLPGIGIMAVWLVATFVTSRLVFRWNEEVTP